MMDEIICIFSDSYPDPFGGSREKIQMRKIQTNAHSTREKDILKKNAWLDQKIES